ncbi:hypothetical protein [Demequina sediminicola]|uniref:primosomal protein N' family DNA-binding protein n=1 Tax=Demequina sediminicola TaxID=1095026 RepID=UPI000784524E|nr:hypothetical protein [Demequina sediminicola]
MAAPIARVRLDSPLPHLDRDFDYAIPQKLAEVVQIGSRVRVPFAGRLVGAIVTQLATASSFEGKLLEVKSSSAIPSFTSQALDLASQVARRYGGSLWDVCRLMAPPRVASVEKREWGNPERDAAYVDALERCATEPLVGPGERAVWQGLPEAEGRCSIPAAAVVATAVARLHDGGSHDNARAAEGANAADGATSTAGSVVIVVPDARAQKAVLAECERLGLKRWSARSGGQVAVLDHDDGQAARFGAFLAAMHGHARIVIGTRPSVMQPVPRLNALVMWDEANGVYEEPHAPYPHARTIAAMRAHHGAAVVIGGYALSVDATALAERGWARWIEPPRDVVRAATPAMDILSDERREAEGGAGRHWMPGSAWRALRQGLERGPVGVMVPRAGYVNATACAYCDEWAVCRDCESPLAVSGHGSNPVCIENAHPQPDWHCPHCKSARLKQLRQGVERIAEQLARMAAGVELTVSSAATGIVSDFEVERGLVIATPSALPAVHGGYAHVVVIDSGVPAGMGLGGELKAIRWWLSVAALVRDRRSGGAVTFVGEMPPTVRRALGTWSPVDAAKDLYLERAELGFPPHRRVLQIGGEPAWVSAALERANIVDGQAKATVVPRPDGVSVLLTRGAAQEAVDVIREVQREASKNKGELRMRVDAPLEF